MESPTRYTFKKDEKLKSRKIIEQLFRDGQSFSSFPFRVLWKVEAGQVSKLQAGVAVSSKHFKKAVDRNRVKRLMREAWRLQKPELQGLLAQQQKCLVVFLIYVGNQIPVYAQIFEKTGIVLKRLIKLTNENDQSNT